LDFNAGGTATGKTARHAFAAPGDYEVSLQVTDGCGFTKDYTATIHIGMLKVYMPLATKGPKP